MGGSAAMFDYDSRPVTPQVTLIGTRSSAAAYAIRDFLTRNGRPYDWVDVDQARADGRPVDATVASLRLPLCVLPDGTRIEAATVERVAVGLGMITAPSLAEYDLTIIGGGPAGLAAGVYAASEGLATVILEGEASGGQAGTTSAIENYLGFPDGVSGSTLATRATVQARRFGAEILVPRRVVGVSVDGSGYLTTLADGTIVRGRALLFATGVAWRRLEAPGVDRLLGAGVYYGAGPSEALGSTGARVVVVGGGNSAGQAAARFSRYASRVTLLVRGDGIGDSMSQYLVDRVLGTDNIEVRTGTQVVDVVGNGQLRAVDVIAGDGHDPQRLPAEALFICIGGVPQTECAAHLGIVRDAAGYVVTGTDLMTDRATIPGWGLRRQPFPLETNLPGVFVAGDCRHASIKRCAAAIGEGAMAVALVHRRLAELGRA